MIRFSLLLALLVFSVNNIFGETVFKAHHMVLEAVFDGEWIYATTQSGRINRFNYLTKKQGADLISLNPEGEQVHGPVVYSLSISPNKKRLAAGTGRIGKLILFEIPNGKLVRAFKIRDTENIVIVRFLSDSQIILGLMDGSVILFDIEQSKELYRNHIEYAPISNIVLSPDHLKMAVATQTTTIKLVDIKEGSVLKEFDGHKDSVYGVTFIDNDTLLSGGKDGHLIRWNLNTHESKTLYEKGFYITAVAWNNQKLIAFLMPDYKIGIMDRTTDSIIKILSGHYSFINGLLFTSPSTLISYGNDAKIIIHQL